MSNGDICAGQCSETTSLAAKPLVFATTLSVGLHVAIFMWMVGGPKPIDVGLNAEVDAIHVELVVPNEANAVAPSVAGSLAAAASQQETTVPPPPPAVEQAPSNDFPPQPKPVKITAPQEEAQTVIERPAVPLAPKPVDTEALFPRKSSQPPSEARTAQPPGEAEAPSPAASAVVEQAPNNPIPSQPKPVTVTDPQKEAQAVIERPAVALAPEPVDAEGQSPRESIQPPSEAKIAQPPVVANAPAPATSPAEVKRPEHTAPTPKPVASEPKPSAVEHQSEDRKPAPVRRPKPGAGAKAGQAGSAQLADRETAAAPSGKNEPLALYLASIRAKIAAQQSGRPSAERGRVDVRFSVAADGRLGNVVVERSDDDALEEEALRIVRRSSPVAPIPPSTGKTSLTMSLVMEFK